MTLHLVCDTSGSMCEAGKAFIMRTLVKSVAQWMLYGHGRTEEVTLWAWGSDACRLADWDTNSEYPDELLSCTGTANALLLIQSLGDKPDGKVMIMTDGFWAQDDARNLRRWMGGLPSNTLRIIKIGPDANSQLKGTNIFESEELFAALDGWLEGSTT